MLGTSTLVECLAAKSAKDGNNRNPKSTTSSIDGEEILTALGSKHCVPTVGGPTKAKERMENVGKTMRHSLYFIHCCFVIRAYVRFHSWSFLNVASLASLLSHCHTLKEDSLIEEDESAELQTLAWKS